MSNNKIIGLGAAIAVLAAAQLSAWGVTAHDYDGDGKADVGVYTPGSGNWSLRLSASGDSAWVQNWGWDESRPVCGDFDGDGKADLAVYDGTTYKWYVRLSSSGALALGVFGTQYSRPVPMDYTGDGKTDLAIYERDGGNWWINPSGGGSPIYYQFGYAQARAIPGDYDGDGKADLAVFDRQTAVWYIRQSTSGFRQVQFGWNQARPVPADYDGDGKTDLAVYHPSTGNWYILQSSDQQLHVINWGWIAARPAVADYDGDGKADLCVYHRAAGTWYIRLSGSGNALRLVTEGNSSSCAIPTYQTGGVQNLIILAFGDSITYGTSSSSNGPDTGYPIRLERILGPAWGGHCSIVNGGKPGERTEAGRQRIGTLLNNVKPDLTLIMEGTNDEFGSVPYSTTESNLRNMISQAKQAGSAVILSTIPPVIKSDYRDRTAQEQRIEGFNPRISNIARSAGAFFCDNWKAIATKPNWQRTLMDQQTANHPNDAGYVVMRDAWFRAINDAMLAGGLY